MPNLYRGHGEREDQSAVTSPLFHFTIIGHFNVKFVAQRVGFRTGKSLVFLGQSQAH